LNLAASAAEPAAETASLRWLRSLNALTRTAWSVCLWSALGTFTIVLPPVFVVVVFVFVLCLVVIAVAGLMYLAILFFCHSQYSLRTLMIAVIVLGLGLSLVVSGGVALRVVGGLMLYALVMEIIFGIQQFDPLRDMGPAGEASSKNDVKK
jgi:hypothetical protein